MYKYNIYIYIYIWQNNDQFVLKEMHVITKKYCNKSFNGKSLASIIANVINIIKICYSRITNSTNNRSY